MENSSDAHSARLAREHEQFLQLQSIPHGSEEWIALRGEIISEHLPLARYVARRHDYRGENVEDLAQIASLALVKAVDDFDVTKGFAFSTYATPVILGEIRRHFRDHGSTVRIPRNIQSLRGRIARATDEWTATHNRPPDQQQLAEILDVSVEDVVEALASVGVSSSIDDVTADEVVDSSSEHELEQVEIHEALTAAMGVLDEREREVIWWRFFGDESQSQVARRFNISQMQVSRIQQRALSKLRDNFL